MLVEFGKGGSRARTGAPWGGRAGRQPPMRNKGLLQPRLGVALAELGRGMLQPCSPAARRVVALAQSNRRRLRPAQVAGASGAAAAAAAASKARVLAWLGDMTISSATLPSMRPPSQATAGAAGWRPAGAIAGAAAAADLLATLKSSSLLLLVLEMVKIGRAHV